MTSASEQQPDLSGPTTWRSPLAALALPVLWQWRAARCATTPSARRTMRHAALAVAVPFVVAGAIIATQWQLGAGWMHNAALFSPKEVALVTALVSIGLLGSVASTALTGAEGLPTRRRASARRRAATRRRALRLTATGAAAMALVPAAAGLYYAVPAQGLMNRTFVAAPAAVPSPLRATSASTPTGPSAAGGTPAEPLGTEARFNVLLVGGDAGQDRDGLRTDSMNVVSIDRASGDTVIIGVPRNLGDAPLPPGPLAERFPDGYDDLLNAVYGWGQANPNAVRKALGPTDEPGASLLAASIAEFTGLRIDGWVLVDMAGFLEVVDALGGVDLYVTQEVPSPGNILGAKHVTPEVYTVGLHHLDGTDTLDYSRSREADSDYERMDRQRCVLANLAAQHGGPELLRRWPALASALSSTVRTNLTVSQMVGVIEQLQGAPTAPRSIGLVPPEVPEYDWDAAEVRALVAATLAGPPPTTMTTTTTTTVRAPTTTSTTEYPEVVGSPSEPFVVVSRDDECVVLSGR